MGYRLANVSNGRTVGGSNSGPRTLGYDANPRGLAGTNSNIRRLAGTNNTASDYKAAKKKKEKKKEKEKDKKKEPEKPYPPDPSEVPPEMKPYTGESDEDAAPLVRKKGGDFDGDGWQLILHGYEEGETPFTQVKQETVDMFSEKYWTYAELRDTFHIINVSDVVSVKLPTAPLENGMVKHDHKVVEPKTLRVTGWVEENYTDWFNDVIEFVRESKSLDTYFTLVSPWKKHEKMYLKRLTSKVSTDKYDVYEYTLELQELLIAQTKTDTTKDPGLASNSKKGASKRK